MYSVVPTIFILLGFLYFSFLSYFHPLLLLPIIVFPVTFSFALPFRLYLLSPPSACCHWHWVSRAGWAVHIPTIFLSQWLNIKQWQTLGSRHPPPLHLFPLCFRFHVSRSSHSHSASFLTTSGPFPRAPIWSPWWLKGCPEAESCWLRVKVFHQRILPLSTIPTLLSELLLDMCTKNAYTFIFPHIFPLMSHLFLSKKNIFEVSVSKHCRCASEFSPQAEIRFYSSACINNQ